MLYETEKKFFITDIRPLEALLISNWFGKMPTKSEERDIYFVDKDGVFIPSKICLRIRESNGSSELTYKGPSLNMDPNGFYSKLECNIPIGTVTEAAVHMLEALGFLKYVEVKKARATFSKQESDATFNVSIDTVENAGNFVEFEILTLQPMEDMSIFLEFIRPFSSLWLEETSLPYRDIVRNNIEKSII